MVQYSIFLLTIVSSVLCQKDPHFAGNGETIVHLFEWKWKNIAKECEEFLSKKGYGAVQVSPPNENIIVAKRPWWERYQPISYKLITRSGNEEEFKDMIERCNSVGVRIYVDAVINHMAASTGIGTGGSKSLVELQNISFPAVPYKTEDFHQQCAINNYNNAEEVRNCDLVGLKDLNQALEDVREKIIEYMNHLIDLGVAGFRVDAVKHMNPDDLGKIFNGLKDLSTSHGFELNSRPFIYQEVIDLDDSEAIHREEYIHLGRVLEFRFGRSISKLFRGEDELLYVSNWGTDWGFLESDDAVTFVDNHDNQRSDSSILTYKSPKLYKMAVAFMLAHPYGLPRIMSSFAFDYSDQPPPQDENEDLISPSIGDDNVCSNGWICEHRWRQIYNMVEFRSLVNGTGICNWWSNNDQQIAFSRGSIGFIAINNGGNLDKKLQTGLPRGVYCDIISGHLENGLCVGKTVVVDADGIGHVTIHPNEDDGVLALHVKSLVDPNDIFHT